MSNVCVFVVEDDPITRMALTEALQDAGHDVREAETASEALRMMEQVPCDILVTDIQLADGSTGIEVAQAARQRDPRLPVVFVSGRPQTLGGLGALGPRDAFIRKPYLPSEVIGAIRRLLAA